MKNFKKLIKESKKRSEKYQAFISESEKTFRDLNADNMQAVLIQFEDFLDSNHLYAYDNWFDGVVYDGPNIQRYWVDVTLKYPHKSMPDPKGGIRLYNLGATVSYKQSTEYVPIKVENPDDLDPLTGKPKEEKRSIWLVNIRLPRKFIENAIDDEQEQQEQIWAAQAEKEANEAEQNDEQTDSDEELDLGGDEL